MGSRYYPMKNFTLEFLPNAFISLLSTGLDSPIATYLMLIQGFNAYTLSFLNGGNESELNRQKILKIGHRLVELTHKKLRMFFLNYDFILDNFISSCERKITCLLCKRTMLSIAGEIAKKNKALFIINGDILGEQASQTLDNLLVVNQINREIPVIRPLIGFDKSEIIKLNQKLGFYDISLIKAPGCVKNPKYPETHAKIQDIMENEKKINRVKIQEEILSNLTVVDL